jgi:hypothetical protein
LGIDDAAAGEVLRKCVIDSIYALVLQDLKQKNYTTVSMGGVYPFINNGLAFYKMDWGAKPSPDLGPSSSWFRFLIRRSTPAVMRDLAENPFWFVDANESLRVALISENGLPDPEILKLLNKRGLENGTPLRFSDLSTFR